VTSANLTGVVKKNDLGVEGVGALGGSFLESPATLPRRISLTETSLTLNPTLSAGTPSTSCSWCISTDFTSVVTLAGAKVTTWGASALVRGFCMRFRASQNMLTMPDLLTPVSTRPTGTVPMPPILYTSWRGRRRGLSIGREGGSIASIASKRVLPVVLVLVSFSYPLYHGQFRDSSTMLSPLKPDIRTKGTVMGLYPTFLMKFKVSLMISW